MKTASRPALSSLIACCAFLTLGSFARAQSGSGAGTDPRSAHDQAQTSGARYDGHEATVGSGTFGSEEKVGSSPSRNGTETSYPKAGGAKGGKVAPITAPKSVSESKTTKNRAKKGTVKSDAAESKSPSSTEMGDAH